MLCQLAILLGAFQATSCLEHPIKLINLEHNLDDACILQINPKREVDVLFVIDNSGSMAEEQGLIAESFAQFVSKLEEPEVRANYRFAVVTTDLGNFQCNKRPGEDGRFMLRSCRSHEHDFIEGNENYFVEACANQCSEEWTDIQTIPSALERDGELRARPWIEYFEGVSNLPDGLSTTQAFQCLGPQGVAGCHHESPLEAMLRGLTRAQDKNDANYGFLREDAFLAVVILTDEVDCSSPPSSDIIFDPNGGKHFWPNELQGSSAVCWNAGVSCTEEGCDSENFTIDGSLAETPADAVLYPVARYVDFLHKLDKKVFVSVIAGVPVGYPDVPIPYIESEDPIDQDAFGIGPGCTTTSGGRATPPVRLREFAEAFAADGQQNLYSICGANYEAALQSVADAFIKEIPQSCYNECANDIDPEIEGLQANCQVFEQISGEPDRNLKACTPLNDHEWMIPAGEEDCFYVRTDAKLHMDCQKQGANLQFEIIRKEGTFPRSGSTISARCETSPRPSLDCPNLVSVCQTT